MLWAIIKTFVEWMSYLLLQFGLVFWKVPLSLVFNISEEVQGRLYKWAVSFLWIMGLLSFICFYQYIATDRNGNTTAFSHLQKPPKLFSQWSWIQVSFQVGFLDVAQEASSPQTVITNHFLLLYQVGLSWKSPQKIRELWGYLGFSFVIFTENVEIIRM